MNLITDQRIKKVGVNIGSDLAKIGRDFNCGTEIAAIRHRLIVVVSRPSSSPVSSPPNLCVHSMTSTACRCPHDTAVDIFDRSMHKVYSVKGERR